MLITIRLNATQCFIIKIPNSRELQQIALNNLSELSLKQWKMGLPGTDLNLGQKIKKVKFKKKKNFVLGSNLPQQSLNFPLLKTLKNYFLYVKNFFKILKFVLGIFNFQLLYRTLKIIFHVLNNNFSYTQLSLVFLLEKDSSFDNDDTDAFFLFLLQKDFGTFHVLLIETFLCFF